MVGNRVALITDDQTRIMGVLHKLDDTGATLYRESDRVTVFIPMRRIHEIVNYGREPG